MKNNFETQQIRFWSSSKEGRRSPQHPVVRMVFQEYAQYAAQSGGVSVLDLGCGNGFLQYYLHEAFSFVVGLDMSPSMLALNTCPNRIRGDCQQLPFADNSFDIVCESNMLHHLDCSQRHKAVREMQRVARKAVVVFEPNRANALNLLFALVYKEERKILELSRTHLRDLLGVNAKIEIRGWITPNKFTYPLALVGSFINKTPLRRFGFDLFAFAPQSE